MWCPVLAELLFPDSMHPTSNDLSFNLFGFHTSIQPFFWLIAGLITALNIGGINDNMPFWIGKLLIGMAGVMLSVLVHELGHAFSFRYLFNTPCAIVLHGFGGAAVPLQNYQYKNDVGGVAAKCFLSFSGPLAGFMFAFVMLGIVQSIPTDDRVAIALLRFFLGWTAIISIIWGIFNLLPIYPMDGGHIARDLFVFLSPRQGVKLSLIFSMTCAVLLAVLAIRHGFIFAAFFCAYFVYQNYLELSFNSFRR